MLQILRHADLSHELATNIRTLDLGWTRLETDLVLVTIHPSQSTDVRKDVL